MIQRRLDMQREVRATLRQTALVAHGRGDKADEVEDFGFYHPPGVVLSCWFALRNWNILPVAGGWLDQPEAWRYDLLTVQAVYNEEYEQAEDTGPTMDDLLEQSPTRLPMFGE